MQSRLPRPRAGIAVQMDSPPLQILRSLNRAAMRRTISPMRTIAWWCMVVGMVGASVSCRSRPQPVSGESTIRLTATDAAADEALWVAVQDSLRDYCFRIDRVDLREGVVTTLPETSKQYFEFWRRDAVTAYDVWESSINPMRRWVEVRAVKEPPQSQRVVAVTVHKERLSSPDRQFNNSTAAYRFFGDALPSTTGIMRVTPEYDRWLAMGRDPALEARLVEQIVRRSKTQVLAPRGSRDMTTEPAQAPPVEGGAPTPVEAPQISGNRPTGVEVQTSRPAVTPPPTIMPQTTPAPSSDDSAAIIPMRDVEGSTPSEPGKEADDTAARP